MAWDGWQKWNVIRIEHVHVDVAKLYSFVVTQMNKAIGKNNIWRHILSYPLGLCVFFPVRGWFMTLKKRNRVQWYFYGVHSIVRYRHKYSIFFPSPSNWTYNEFILSRLTEWSCENVSKWRRTLSAEVYVEFINVRMNEALYDSTNNCTN